MGPPRVGPDGERRRLLRGLIGDALRRDARDNARPGRGRRRNRIGRALQRSENRKLSGRSVREGREDMLRRRRIRNAARRERNARGVV